jgi:hypothetical protein
MDAVDLIWGDRFLHISEYCDDLRAIAEAIPIEIENVCVVSRLYKLAGLVFASVEVIFASFASRRVTHH